jgi:amino acid transporter
VVKAIGLARKSVSGGMLVTGAVTASSPMTVLAGGLITTYAATGVVGVPLSFVVVVVALVPMTVGFVAAARHVPHPAPVYALVARGLGRPAGVAAGAVAVVAYAAIGTSLYGLLGAIVAGLVGGVWWAWALVAWLVVSVAGSAAPGISLRLLVGLLLAQVAVLVLVDVTALRHPADGVSVVGFTPGAMLVDGVGGAVAFAVAALIGGFDTPATFGEEARHRHTVARASLVALLFLGGLYAVTAWTLAVGVGADRVVEVARDPGGNLPFGVLMSQVPAAVGFATVVLVLAVVAAMVAFHHAVARYVFALGRERVLPARWAKVGVGAGRRGGAPVAGSWVQSAIVLVVIGVAALAGVDPIAVVFTWLSTIAAVGVLALWTAGAWAAKRFFADGGGTDEGWLVRVAAPTVGVVAGVGLLFAIVGNLDALLSVEAGSPLRFVPVFVIGLAGVVGLRRGFGLRRNRPDIYQRIGHGTPHVLAVPDARLAELDV